MADDEPGRWQVQLDDNRDGGGYRATTQLIDAKVDGLKDLVRAEFANVREDLRALAGMAGEIIKLQARGDEHDRRIRALEEHVSRRREYRAVNLPIIVLAALSSLVGIIELLTKFIH